MSDALETLAEGMPGLLMFLGLGIMFVAGAAGFEVVAAFGLAMLVAGPVVGGTVGELLLSLAGDRESTTEDPLEALRDRYARGELSEAEFERRLERLLETEDREVPGRESERDVERTEPGRERE